MLEANNAEKLNTLWRLVKRCPNTTYSGLISALGWVAPGVALPWLEYWLGQTEFAGLQMIALRGYAIRRIVPPTPLDSFFRSPHAFVRAAACMLAGRVRMHSMNAHKLILSSTSTACEPIDGDPEIAWHHDGGANKIDKIGRFSPMRQVVSGKVALSNYDFKSPTPQRLSETSDMEQGDSIHKVEVYEYEGLYGYKNEADGRNIARRCGLSKGSSTPTRISVETVDLTVGLG